MTKEKMRLCFINPNKKLEASFFTGASLSYFEIFYDCPLNIIFDKSLKWTNFIGTAQCIKQKPFF